MSTRLQLNSYIARVQRRLQLQVTLRGLAILTCTAFALTIALVLLLNHYAFPAHGVSNARFGMIATLALVAALTLALPLTRLTRTRAVGDAERAHPHLEQRLTTFHQRTLSLNAEPTNPLLDLLAADTLARTETSPPAALAPAPRLLAFAAAALAAAAALLWTITSAPGFLGYGASLLWQGAKPHVVPFYALAVTPGDVAVRRNSDQLITAQLTGLSPEKVQLFARYGSAPAWEPVVMQPQPDAVTGSARGYQFVFTGLPESVEYYVAAGPLTSPHYKVRVVDLPSVKAIRVTYHYPRWTGMKSVTEEHSGDLRAIEGTNAQVELEMDRPLKDGQLLLDDGHALHLATNKSNTYEASIHMGKDGAYHVSATDAGQSVRLSEDYLIATDKALLPEVALDRPGRDYRASPIEEVTVGVKASGQFGLNDMHLHYSVNGGPDRDVSLLKSPAAKDAASAYTLRLEDFKLVPGDLVSLYATAKDGHAEARTDITFIQAEPFEREFSQSQQGGGGGGGGGGGQQNNQTEISKREKELVAATWKQQNDKAATPKDAATAGQFLADAQSKLRDQVLALSARMQSRDLSAATEEFSGFEKDMQTAAAAMAPSTGKLKDMQWKDALPLEQKALQALLRAEATFRQIQVAFGQQQGGGGGGSSAGRDLASLFDLELDTAKNQYETAQTASPAEQHAKDVESALEKLDALAKRQEELAGNQHNPQQSFEERWQQEMLRREAEQLQRQMEQLAKDNQAQQGSGQQRSGRQEGGQQSGGKQQSSASSFGQSGSASSPSDSRQQTPSSQNGSQGQNSAQRNSQQSAQSAADPRIEQALSRLQQAAESMKRSGGPQQDNNAARQAANRLRQAAGLLGQTQQQLASGKADSLSREADRLTEQERQQAAEIDKLAHDSETASPSGDAAAMMVRVRERNRLAAERQQLSNDLSKLQKNLRDAAREMASKQSGAAQKLREALTDMDQSDLDNHVQRTADWLRRGINPNSNGTEAGIAKGFAKLNQQLRQAQQAGGPGPAKPGQRWTISQRGQGSDQTAALGQVERLRSQLEAMTRSRDGQQPGQSLEGARNGQAGQRGNQSGNQPGNQSGSKGQPNGNNQLSGRSQGQGQGRGGNQPSDQTAQSNQQQGGGTPGRSTRIRNSGQSQSTQASDRSGDISSGGGGYPNGTAWNNVNTGNNTYGPPGQRPTPTSGVDNPADAERIYQQSIRELNQLRGMVGGDPQVTKEVADLTRRMQQLDPKRFPGNPAMVEQLHREMLSDVDRLELQLQRADTAPEARTGKASTVPTGYADSVADYYRRLSAKQ